MQRLYVVCGGMVSAALLSACATSISEGVRITQQPADVASCTAVGHVAIPRNAYGDVNKDVAQRQFRSRTKELGGNTALVSIGPLGSMDDATAYRCP